MDSEAAQKASSNNPSVMLASLLSRRAKLQDELRGIEKQVYDLETSYLQDPTQCGNVLKGFEGFLSSSKNTNLLKRSRKFQPEDRMFSLSSVTSPAAEELAAARDGKAYIGKYATTMGDQTLVQVGPKAVYMGMGKESQRREDLHRGTRRESDLQANKITTMKMMLRCHSEWGTYGLPFHMSSTRARARTERFRLRNLVIVESHASQASKTPLFTCRSCYFNKCETSNRKQIS
ncbi:hypothetical protein C1H46_000791 [Malus baccata]|uniref:Chromatin modification-related protein MEAF6 n=1 Tax=Malus baccata TaxID=106549 RepID=A0A540NRX5_MALBA|nr:hypothetical protein C1H46_000791 [Malus baccata]